MQQPSKLGPAQFKSSTPQHAQGQAGRGQHSHGISLALARPGVPRTFPEYVSDISSGTAGDASPRIAPFQIILKFAQQDLNIELISYQK